MMYFISCCNSKSYENTDGQPGGHRSRRGRGPRMAWSPWGTPKSHGFSGAPPSAVLEGGAHKRSAVGRIAPKGRTSRGPLPAGDCPTGESAPFRPDALRQRPAVTCGRTKRADIVRQEGADRCFVRPGACTQVHRQVPVGSYKPVFEYTLPSEWTGGIGRGNRVGYVGAGGGSGRCDRFTRDLVAHLGRNGAAGTAGPAEERKRAISFGRRDGGIGVDHHGGNHGGSHGGTAGPGNMGMGHGTAESPAHGLGIDRTV